MLASRKLNNKRQIHKLRKQKRKFEVEFLSKYNVIYVDNYNVRIVHILMQKLIAII